jgi:flagellar assembly protein FliH
MATIIRLADPPHGLKAEALNFDDLAAEAGQYVTDVKAEAAEIIAQAQSQADSIRQQAAREGAEAGVRATQQIVAEQLAPALVALQQAAADLQHAKQAWLSHWRIVRGELRRQPEITLRLVREALELAAGSSGVRLHLNPEDHKALGAQVRALVDAMSGLGDAEIAADAAIGRGGCRVETRFGTIDQQFESQLKRIEEELTG